MTAFRFVRRYKWSILIVLAAVAAWWPAFNYLADFRPPDVPYVPTPNDVVAAMLDLAEVTEADTVYDLGSGDGRVVIAAARDRGAHAVGIEIDPELAEQSREAVRAAGLADRVTIRRGDIFKQDLTPATVVAMYLKPLVNVQLRPQFDQLRPGTRIVSHMFSMPGARPTKRIEVRSAETGLEHSVYLWVVPIEWDE
jgi:protein-L-isoaspartate O-methyltransferase